MTSIAISQSNYLPWRGYFSLINSVDVFVLYDSVQYTRRDWRNRNIIKVPSGTAWISVPVASKGNYNAAISTIKVSDPAWAAKHIRAIELAYARSRYFDSVFPFVAELISSQKSPFLSEINRNILIAVADYIGIDTEIVLLKEYPGHLERSERLAEIAASYGASSYISGPAAKDYLEASYFESRGIEVSWFSYGPFPVYDQLWGDFAENVSVLDLLMNVGNRAKDYIVQIQSAHEGSKGNDLS